MKTGWKFTLETSLSVKKESIENIIHCIDYFIVDTKDMDKQDMNYTLNGVMIYFYLI